MPAVRVIKKTIATLLAAQLFAVFGLSGAACCLQAQAATASEAPSQSHSPSSPQPHSHANHHQTYQQAMAHGHCHAKAEKSEQLAASIKSQIQPAPSAHHHQSRKSAGHSIVIVPEQRCQCSAVNQENLAASLTQLDSSPQKGKQLTFVALPAWQYADQLQPSPSVSPPPSLSHSPPFGGFRLTLRI